MLILGLDIFVCVLCICFRFNSLCSCLGCFVLVLFGFLVLGLISTVVRQEIVVDLFCVEKDVKP